MVSYVRQFCAANVAVLSFAVLKTVNHFYASGKKSSSIGMCGVCLFHVSFLHHSSRKKGGGLNYVVILA